MSLPPSPSRFNSPEPGAAWFELRREGQATLVYVTSGDAIIRRFQAAAQRFLPATYPSMTRSTGGRDRRRGDFQADGIFGPETADAYLMMLAITYGTGARAEMLDFIANWREGRISGSTVQGMAWMALFLTRAGTLDAPLRESFVDREAIVLPPNTVPFGRLQRSLVPIQDQFWVAVYNPATSDPPRAPSLGGSPGGIPQGPAAPPSVPASEPNTEVDPGEVGPGRTSTSTAEAPVDTEAVAREGDTAQGQSAAFAGLPWWAWLAIGGGVLLAVGIGVAIYMNQKKKNEMGPGGRPGSLPSTAGSP